MSVLPTVLIKSEALGCETGIRINESDFDPDVHELWSPEPPTEEVEDQLSEAAEEVEDQLSEAAEEVEDQRSSQRSRSRRNR